ncbi:hypothetical protein OsJ_20883 [Oryza sativa Japonica Group]|uniref:Uncharacterized protein n=1 Tax=Oryza sativa subsp. japonica TaxID=39947 RepID=A3BAF3_ORYSJ|nr:hypothetical protein OsJ_20883 [Oryza sativa Japonica Group]
MGNSIGGRRKGAKVMQLDGTAFRVKPPAFAGTVLRDHPGFQLLESEEVKLLGVRARPLAHDAPLRPGRLYFLVALPRPRAPPRAALVRGATRRRAGAARVADAHPPVHLRPLPPGLGGGRDRAAVPDVHRLRARAGGPVRLRMRLPKAQVEKLMGESRDSAEAAAKIMQLCAAANANGGASGAATPERGILRTPERSPRFIPTPDWGVAGGFARTPEVSPRFAATPEWGTGFMMPTPERSGLLRTPERWPTLPRTPEYSSRDVKAARKERTRKYEND